MSQEKIEIAIVGPKFEALLATYMIVSRCKFQAHAFVTNSESTTPCHSLFGYLGAIDNFTRLAVAHGEATAKDLWNMTLDGIDLCAELAFELNLHHKPLNKLRLIRTEHEHIEANEASRLMQGLPANEQVQGTASAFPFLNLNEIPYVQFGQPRGFSWDLESAMIALERVTTGHVTYVDRPTVAEAGDGIVVSSQTWQRKAEFALLLDRPEIAQIAPIFSEVLVQVPSYWLELQTPQRFPQDSFFMMEHGNLWGAQVGSRLAFGGARYLAETLPEEHTSDPRSQRLIDHLSTNFLSTFADPSPLTHVNLKSVTACLPCDEMPVAGPFFANHRIAFANGFLGWGINMYVASVAGIIEVINGEWVTTLPRILWPERHRSL